MRTYTIRFIRGTVSTTKDFKAKNMFRALEAARKYNIVDHYEIVSFK